jgi:predicted nucleic acid-binding protein
MTTFVDTSALFALVHDGDPAHARGLSWLEGITLDADEQLLTHSYVVTEAIVLTHARLGTPAVRMLLDDVIPAFEVRYVDEALHQRATTAYLAGLNRKVSFVDRTSFELMRAEGIRRAFAFDRDFAKEGFETVP